MVEEINVHPHNIILNRENNYNRSYKITINNNDKYKVFDPNNWENNIIIKPFRQRSLNYTKHQTNINNGNNTQ